MKAVQIGILVALLVCAGLLFRIYQARQAAPAESAATPVAAATPPTAAPAIQAAPAQPAVEAAPVRHKPAPARSAPKPAEQVAENRAPVADPMASQAPPEVQGSPVSPPLEPTPAPQPAVVLNVPATPPEPRQPHSATIPAGTLITVRLADSLNSDKNHAGDAFSATLDQALVVDGFAVAERGAHVDGKVIDNGQGGKELALQLIKLHTSDGQDVPIATERFTREGTVASGKQSGEKVAGGAVLGAVIGAIAGGGRGAAIGAGAGGAAGGGVAAATHRKPAQLPVETRLTFRLSQPVTLTERVE
ncbi:MAG: hypothetical protein ABSH46_05630 [Bryobacteraceae bacterium]|jgi:hypothetical protein